MSYLKEKSLLADFFLLDGSICYRYNEALKIKTDSWEATASMGQLEWERAKARIGYIVPTLRLVSISRAHWSFGTIHLPRPLILILQVYNTVAFRYIVSNLTRAFSIDDAKEKEEEEAKESAAASIKAALAKLDAKKV